jgi:hypothetical protein
VCASKLSGTAEGLLRAQPSLLREILEDSMEKKILQYSYWLGLLCMAIAVVWRVANVLGFWVLTFTPVTSLSYMSFFKAALLLLLTATATSAYLTANR